MEPQTKYLSTSWRLLTQQGGGLRLLRMACMGIGAVAVVTPVDLALAQALFRVHDGVALWTILALVTLIPAVIVSLGISGSLLEHARLVAFGIDQAPRQAGTSIKTLVVTGFRGFVVVLAYGILVAIVVRAPFDMLTRRLFGANLPILVRLVELCVGLMWSVVLPVLMLRAVVFRRIKAAFMLRHAWMTIRSDMGGLLRIIGMGLYVGALVFVGVLFIGMTAGAFMQGLATSVGLGLSSVDMLLPPVGANTMQEWQLAMAVTMLSQAGIFIVALLVMMIPIMFFLLIAIGMNYLAIGLWMRQFDVVTWDGVRDVPNVKSVPASDAGDAPAEHVAVGEPVEMTGVASDAVSANANAMSRPAPQDSGRDELVEVEKAALITKQEDARATQVERGTTARLESAPRSSGRQLAIVTDEPHVAQAQTIGELLQGMASVGVDPLTVASSASASVGPAPVGWTYDRETGLYYDPQSTWCFDAKTAWYYDTATGWFYSESEGWRRDEGPTQA